MSCFLSGEPAMYDAYLNGKDLYSVIASSAIGNTYEECLEFWPEGKEIEVEGRKVIAGHKTHLNKQGKENRNIGKQLLLASTYGMGATTAGSYMGKSAEDGQKLLDGFFAGFPELKKAIDESKEFLKNNEYVEDFVGRRRHLPEINLPTYKVSLAKTATADDNFNPIIGCTDRNIKDPRIIKWEKAVKKAIDDSQAYRQANAIKEGKTYTRTEEMGNKTYEKLVKEAKSEGVIIQAFTGTIAQATRQCFNSRIQGSAASLTKIAMVDIANDELLNKYQTQLIIPVHDELLVECPEFYADKVEKRLPEVMIEAAKRGGDDVPQSCDPYNVKRWAADTLAAYVLEEYKKLVNGDPKKNILPIPKEEALEKVFKNHEEIPKEALLDVITGKTEELNF